MNVPSAVSERFINNLERAVQHIALFKPRSSSTRPSSLKSRRFISSKSELWVISCFQKHSNKCEQSKNICSLKTGNNKETGFIYSEVSYFCLNRLRLILILGTKRNVKRHQAAVWDQRFSVNSAAALVFSSAFRSSVHFQRTMFKLWICCVEVKPSVRGLFQDKNSLLQRRENISSTSKKRL